MQPLNQLLYQPTDAMPSIESLSTEKLDGTAQVLEQQIVALLCSSWDNMAKAQALQHQKLLNRIQHELNHRRGSDGMPPWPNRLNRINMDFRILLVDNRPVLLERFQDDQQWQVYITSFMDQVNRYDEWLNFPTVEGAQTYIASYSEESARDFVDRGAHWLASGAPFP